LGRNYLITARELIKAHEGLRLRPYLCSENHLSIGYGWNLDVWPIPPEIASYLRINGAITEEMADALLEIRFEGALRDCKQLYPGFDGFSDRRKEALIDFLYNVGCGKAMKFKKMNKAINSDNWNEAAEELRNSAYWKQLGGDPPGADDQKEERPETLYRMLRDG